MYKLFFSPGACSLATQVILREMGLTVELIHKDRLSDFTEINPVGAVPALADEDTIYTEGAAIILYLLNKHGNSLLPASDDARQKAIENIMLANATMHPAYSKLFFIDGNMMNGEEKTKLMNAAADNISRLWKVVESKLQDKAYLAGDNVGPADILLAVYARWGAFFPVDINIPQRVMTMIENVHARTSFKLSLDAESLASE